MILVGVVESWSHRDEGWLRGGSWEQTPISLDVVMIGVGIVVVLIVLGKVVGGIVIRGVGINRLVQ